jgi:hypothetical protein
MPKALLARFDASGDEGHYGIGLVGGHLYEEYEIEEVLDRTRLAWVQSGAGHREAQGPPLDYGRTSPPRLFQDLRAFPGLGRFSRQICERRGGSGPGYHIGITPYLISVDGFKGDSKTLRLRRKFLDKYGVEDE